MLASSFTDPVLGVDVHFEMVPTPAPVPTPIPNPFTGVVVLAVPKGAPILVGGPPSLDIMAAILASLRTRFISDSLHAALSRLKPSRFRNLMHRAVCFFTGHPVDVASGRVMPGPRAPASRNAACSDGCASCWSSVNYY